MLSVTREGNRLFVEESGQPKFEVAAFGVDAFSSDNGRLVVFLRNEHGKVNQAADPGAGFRRPARAVGRAGAGEDHPGRICAARRRSPGSFQGSGAAARQQGGDPARHRGHAARRPELRADEHGAGDQDPPPGIGGAGPVQRLRRGRVRSSSAALAPAATTSMASNSPGALPSFAPCSGPTARRKTSSSGPTATRRRAALPPVPASGPVKAREDTAPIQLLYLQRQRRRPATLRLDADGKRLARGSRSASTRRRRS